MEINKRILSVLNYLTGPIQIEMNKASFNRLKIDTLKMLEKREIKIIINNNIMSMRIIKNKLDCFAYKNKNCRALTTIDCEHCKFYRNDITWEQIEKDIIFYSGGVINDKCK